MAHLFTFSVCMEAGNMDAVALVKVFFTTIEEISNVSLRVVISVSQLETT